MAAMEFEKSHSYHKLLARYVEDIGCTDCQGGACELSPLRNTEKQVVIEQIVKREGEWVVYLVRADRRQPCQLQRCKLRSCRSERLAQIIGKYTADSTTSPDDQRPSCDQFGFCWN